MNDPARMTQKWYIQSAQRSHLAWLCCRVQPSQHATAPRWSGGHGGGTSTASSQGEAQETTEKEKGGWRWQRPVPTTSAIHAKSDHAQYVCFHDDKASHKSCSTLTLCSFLSFFLCHSLTLFPGNILLREMQNLARFFSFLLSLEKAFFVVCFSFLSLDFPVLSYYLFQLVFVFNYILFPC